MRAFDQGGYVFLATRAGIVKKTELAAFSNPRPSGIIALGVEEEDALIDAVLTSGEDELLLGTLEGMAIHFHERDVRAMGRTAYGVKGIDLEKGDAVVALEVVSKGTVLTVTQNGYGKRTDIEEYRVQGRGGKGLINIKTAGRNGPVVGVKYLRADEEVMLITKGGMIIASTPPTSDDRAQHARRSGCIQLEEADHLCLGEACGEGGRGREHLDRGAPTGTFMRRTFMRNRSVLAGILTVAVLGVACGGPENAIVDNYFKSVRSGDTQTLSSFATVPFPGTVQSWKVLGSDPDQKGPATLADLVKKRADLDAEIAANKKPRNVHARTTHRRHPGPGSPPLRRQDPRQAHDVRGQVDEFNTKDRDLRRPADAQRGERRSGLCHHVAHSRDRRRGKRSPARSRRRT